MTCHAVKCLSVVFFIVLYGLSVITVYGAETITTTATNNSSVGYNWGRIDQPYASQSFTTITGGDLQKIEIALQKVNTPTGDVQIDVFASSGSGVPTGSSLSSATLSAASITSCNVGVFDMSTTTLGAATEYVIRMSVVSGASNVNHWNVCGDGASGNGEYHGYYSGSWATDPNITTRAIIYILDTPGGGGGGGSATSTGEYATTTDVQTIVDLYFNVIVVFLLGVIFSVWTWRTLGGA